MKLNELSENQLITIQLLWGSLQFEMPTSVSSASNNGVYADIYYYDGRELKIVEDNTATCNVFTIDPKTKNRISWNNVYISTVEKNGKSFYYIQNRSFDDTSSDSDRRNNSRIVFHKKGHVIDSAGKNEADIMIHDISDKGISFYAPMTFTPETKQLMITFSDVVEEKEFNLKISCRIKRTYNKAGNVFYGCSLLEENKLYSLYGFLLKLQKKKKDKK